MLKTPITIINSVTLSDGGTKYLIGVDGENKEFSILLAQYIFPEYFNENQVSGRIHLNEKPIPVRSDLEKSLIEALQNCIIKNEEHHTKLEYKKALPKIENSESLIAANNKGYNYGTAYLIKFCIDFVQSDEYIKIAKKVKMP